MKDVIPLEPFHTRPQVPEAGDPEGGTCVDDLRSNPKN